MTVYFLMHQTTIEIFMYTKHFVYRFIIALLLLSKGMDGFSQETELAKNDIHIIPYPKEVHLTGNDFILSGEISIVLDKNASDNEKFSAQQLSAFLKEKSGLSIPVTLIPSKKSILLTRKGAEKKTGDEGYSLIAEENKLTVRAASAAGLFYGVQSIMQLLQKSESHTYIRGIKITDWPDTRQRAAHYDTKHHQDTRAFVESFIRDLAKYKINMLIWEWEDKFEYPSHPEIGAPGAFTLKDMQELTHYARQYHIQIVPLVQGLGHASFILKWPQFAHLREIPASNFEFCPLKDASYQLLNDLWKDAMDATPGSSFVHIGTDETYELGLCADCKKKEQEIGKNGLFHLFAGRSARLIQAAGREPMVWESPMGWAKGRLRVYHAGMTAEKPVTPQKGIILTESYDYETPDLQYAKQAKALGYPVYAYDPNPGIEQLFLPYFFSKGSKGDTLTGSLENSYRFLKNNLGKNVFDGVIRTSWDDSGLPMQAWMLTFATTAAFAWNASAPSLPEFTQTFFSNRYGVDALEMDSVYHLLNEGAYFYMESFEREVWAWGEIGKTHLPDLPRGDALEYDPFWNTRYAERVRQAEMFLDKMDRLISICHKNLQRNIDNKYDIEIFLSLANLIRHTALTYIDLSQLENAIKQAHQQRFVDLEKTYANLQEAAQIVKGSIERRQETFTKLVVLWEKTRLPKGMSTADKKYFFEQDRTRHFANRTADMRYLIVDELQLDMEGYLVQLQKYMHEFQSRFLKQASH